MAALNAAQQQETQGLPSITSLTNGLPRPGPKLSPEQQSVADSTRDSGTWPQPQSKYVSTNNQGLQVHTLLNPDDSPPRGSVPNTPQSARIPHSVQSASSALPSINQGFHPDSNRDSKDYPPTLDSRRSSVDSRMHQGFNNLYINPTSPYESANNSQVSLAASLRRPNGAGPMSPLSGRSSLRGHAAPRVAPPIMPVGRSSGAPDPTAARPTQGFPWAFPDQPIPEERRGSGSDESGSIHGMPSRTNSFAASSIRSSIFSTDSRLPPGQRPLGEDGTTHHHSLQHSAISGLQNDALSGQGTGNYSRTPELRVSHKLAERKRRSEMKDLFEELNKAVPANGGSKASKWEILTKAIEYIRTTQHQERQLHAEVQRLQRDSEYGREARKENEMLKTEVQVMHQHLRRLDPNAPHVYGHFTSQLSAQSGSQTNGNSSISLPPLNPGQSSAAFSGAAMQGVEYGNGFGGR
ncbi:hypothetical protein EJ03DRAFT_272173 [Teratosphaeria nubilosa]|uniref:BHLH domain-containing protein n=1 Tax=Teratosphaeria nubilosa TaxID=161662 RepID=A0A6G1L9C2_9PEZI|nr:hypothetical protein EJ03DRAFT_272173 [Teratosphaeria nubilosa]